MHAGGASQSPSLSDTDMKEFPKPEACVAWVGSSATAPAALLSAVAAAVQEVGLCLQIVVTSTADDM